MERKREKQWRGRKEANEVSKEKRKAKRTKVMWGNEEDGKWLRGKSHLTSAEKDRECKEEEGEERR